MAAEPRKVSRPPNLSLAYLPVRVHVNSALFLSFHLPSKQPPLTKNSQSVVPSTNQREPVENDCKTQKEIEISSLSTLKNPPNCPELSAPITFRRPHGIADTDDKVYLGRGRRGLLRTLFLFERQNHYLIFYHSLMSKNLLCIKIVPL